jgi:hypothetical protein
MSDNEEKNNEEHGIKNVAYVERYFFSDIPSTDDDD